MSDVMSDCAVMKDHLISHKEIEEQLDEVLKPTIPERIGGHASRAKGWVLALFKKGENVKK